MNNHPEIFYDSASPENIPSGVNAAVCINGKWAWRDSDIRRMANVFRYIEVGGEPEWAAHARGIDIEPECVWPVSEAIPFLVARQKHFGDATAYCDRSTLPELRQLCLRAEINPHLWISTLDGTMQVGDEWATQYQDVHNLYDLSVLHGPRNFHGI
jgi:hypothetical protein